MNQTNINMRAVVRVGLIAGLVLLYVSAVGMALTFSGRAIIQNTLTLGRILLFAPPIFAGYYLVKRAIVPTQPVAAFTAAAVAGVVASLPLIILIVLEVTLRGTIREMLANVSADLTELLTYNMGVALGIVIQIIVNIVLVMLGVGYAFLPERVGRSLSTGLLWTLGIGMFGEIFTQILRPVLGNAIRLIFRSGALTLIAAILIFAIASAVGWYWKEQRAKRLAEQGEVSESAKRQRQMINIGLSVALLLVLPWILGTFLSEVMGTVGLFIMMGLGLNIAIGLAGLLDLGYVTNYAVGAYIMGVLTTVPPDGSGYRLSFWLILPLCILGAMLTGFILGLPVLRMRGDYLAIATLGFGEIIRILAISKTLEGYIGGAQGILYIPKPNFFGINLGDPRELYYVILAGCLLVLFVMVRLNNSRTGRQWMAMREDEDVAEAMGINLVKTKLLAFTLSAAAGGLAGGIFSAKLGTVFPNSFNVFVSINVLSVIIVGGMGSIPGIIVGALALIGLPELLREFNEYRFLIYGAVLVWMMLSRPEGLIPSATRRRELHAGEEELEFTADPQQKANVPIT